MTDTPSARTASPDLTSDDGSFWGWVDSERARTGFGLAFFLAVAITAAAIWLVAVAPGATSGSARGSSSQIALIVLAANLLLISGLAIIVGRRVFWRHLIIGERWLLHSDGRIAGAQAEEAAALARFEADTLPRLTPMLNAIRAAVGLDHFGLDVCLRPDGELLVFEANACMNVLDNSTIPPPNMWETPIAAVREALGELHEHPERWLHPGPLPVLAEAV